MLLGSAEATTKTVKLIEVKSMKENASHCLKIHAFGEYPEISISKEKFEELRTAKDKLAAGLALAEKFEILLQNFLELEKELLSISVDRFSPDSGDYTQAFNEKLAMNRRIVNLLTSTKLYIDQAVKHIYPFFDDNEKTKQNVKSHFSEEYDKSSSYRFMELLRNHVQHYGLALHSVEKHSSWVNNNHQQLMEHRIKIFSIRSILEENKSSKKSVLKQMEEEINLKVAAREYIGSLSRVHSKLSKLIEIEIHKSRSLIESCINDYMEANSNNVSGLHALQFEQHEQGKKITDKFYLTLEWDNVRVNLNRKHESIGKIEKKFASGA